MDESPSEWGRHGFEWPLCSTCIAYKADSLSRFFFELKSRLVQLEQHALILRIVRRKKVIGLVSLGWTAGTFLRRLLRCEVYYFFVALFLVRQTSAPCSSLWAAQKINHYTNCKKWFGSANNRITNVALKNHFAAINSYCDLSSPNGRTSP